MDQNIPEIENCPNAEILHDSVRRGLIFFSVPQSTHSMPMNLTPPKTLYPFYFWTRMDQNIPEIENCPNAEILHNSVRQA
jgi:hypothetical protein